MSDLAKFLFLLAIVTILAFAYEYIPHLLTIVAVFYFIFMLLYFLRGTKQ